MLYDVLVDPAESDFLPAEEHEERLALMVAAIEAHKAAMVPGLAQYNKPQGYGVIRCLVENPQCMEGLPEDPVNLLNCVQRIPIVNPDPVCGDTIDVVGLVTCLPTCEEGDRLCLFGCAANALTPGKPGEGSKWVAGQDWDLVPCCPRGVWTEEAAQEYLEQGEPGLAIWNGCICERDFDATKEDGNKTRALQNVRHSFNLVQSGTMVNEELKGKVETILRTLQNPEDATQDDLGAFQEFSQYFG
jgi:hypothetical protein